MCTSEDNAAFRKSGARSFDLCGTGPASVVDTPFGLNACRQLGRGDIRQHSRGRLAQPWPPDPATTEIPRQLQLPPLAVSDATVQNDLYGLTNRRSDLEGGSFEGARLGDARVKVKQSRGDLGD